jgi:hypothetical protein
MGSEIETTDEIIKFKVECNEVEGRKLELWYGKVGTVWPPSARERRGVYFYGGSSGRKYATTSGYPGSGNQCF